MTIISFGILKITKYILVDGVHKLQGLDRKVVMVLNIFLNNMFIKEVIKEGKNMDMEL